MTRPHEETWEAWPGGEVHVVRGTALNFEAGERAPLAAQAPAMARLLLEREWSSDRSYGDYCESCGVDWGVGGRPPATPGVGHRDNCAWLTTMRAAGVLP